MIDPKNLTFEQACAIAGVSTDREFVTLHEVYLGMSDKIGWIKELPAHQLDNYELDEYLGMSDQIGWIKELPAQQQDNYDWMKGEKL